MEIAVGIVCFIAGFFLCHILDKKPRTVVFQNPGPTTPPPRKRENPQLQEFRKELEAHKESEKALQEKHFHVADPTKRKGLQPGNKRFVPAGYVKEIDDQVVKVNTSEFSHRFFGTQLVVDGQPLVTGLPKGTHLLEVVDHVLYVDGVEYKINPSDLDRMVRAVHAHRL